ncbi:hypothetical protein Tco_0876875 [Tanacetum coccineum]|uniref:Uncharacterized protein n=1 Tax=Tanacetum coccineum TaxID=301880 RepID=A0ABQ5BV68_9ASTR
METATLGDKVLPYIVFGCGFNNDGDKLINLEYEVTSTSSMVAMAQEKAQEDDQDDAEGEEKIKFVPRQNVVNFSFTKFPSNWNTANLLELFEEVSESGSDGTTATKSNDSRLKETKKQHVVVGSNYKQLGKSIDRLVLLLKVSTANVIISAAIDLMEQKY